MSNATEKGYLSLKYPFNECIHCDKVYPEIRKVIDLDIPMSIADAMKSATKPEFHLEVTCGNADLCKNLSKMFSREEHPV